MNTTKSTVERDSEAVRIIRELAQQGHAEHWIATNLDTAGVPTLSGRGRWSGKSVWRVCQRHGFTLRWRPGADARASVRVEVSASAKSGQ